MGNWEFRTVLVTGGGAGFIGAGIGRIMNERKTHVLFVLPIITGCTTPVITGYASAQTNPQTPQIEKVGLMRSFCRSQKQAITYQNTNSQILV